MSVESCEYSTFSENDTSLCHKHVLFSDVPFLMPLGSFVVFSVKLESTVSVMCDGVLKVVKIKESGILHGVNHSEVRGVNYVLPAVKEQHMMLRENVSNFLSVPNLTFMIEPILHTPLPGPVSFEDIKLELPKLNHTTNVVANDKLINDVILKRENGRKLDHLKWSGLGLGSGTAMLMVVIFSVVTWWCRRATSAPATPISVVLPPAQPVVMQPAILPPLPPPAPPLPRSMLFEITGVE